ncbi:MAG: hypothetical protein HYY40_14265 [Bacteroidetes bacterium]|nr:hypothetical protein [Bacteroidota bacterium]
MTNYIDCSDPAVKRKINNIIKKLRQGVEIGGKMAIKNLLYNEGYVDLLIATCLGHKYNIGTQGADALDKHNNPVEYKCVAKKEDKYTGSFQFHWLSKNKVKKYRKCSHFYFAWRDGFEVEKIIRVKQKVLMNQIIRKKGRKGSTAGHKSFGCKFIEDLVEKKKARIVYSG